MVNPQTALVYTMVLVSAADGDMTDSELATIGAIVRNLPVFKDFDVGKLTRVAADCAALLGETDGLSEVLGLVSDVLPDRLRETAYALACDVVAADLVAEQAELRVLEMIRHELGVDRLSAAAIERGARARHATV